MKANLLMEETFGQRKVIDFLDSVGRNSRRSKDAYGIALAQFQTFLHNRQDYQQSLESIIDAIFANEIDVYPLLDNFVSHLSKLSLSPATVNLYITAVKSYLQYHDIDISQNKFKRRVRLPRNHNKKEVAIDASDVREILKSCNNIRIKAIFYVLASSGIRITECLMIRYKDIDFDSNPTKITIREEFAKTRNERFVYISDEATKFLKEWIEWKYRERREKSRTPPRLPDHIIFSGSTFVESPQQSRALYPKVMVVFHRILETLKMDEKKDGMSRRKITIHSLRRFVYTTICNCVNQAFAEEYLGHSNTSEYHTMKEDKKKEIYSTKIMKYLTFLDFSSLETTEKTIEARLEEKERDIAYLTKRDIRNEDMIAALIDTVHSLKKQVDDLTENRDKK